MDILVIVISSIVICIIARLWLLDDEKNLDVEQTNRILKCIGLVMVVTVIAYIIQRF